MSLTRDEWLHLWESIKTIELNANKLTTTNQIRGDRILAEVSYIKYKIQQVIGQME